MYYCFNMDSQFMFIGMNSESKAKSIFAFLTCMLSVLKYVTAFCWHQTFAKKLAKYLFLVWSFL